MLDRMRGSKKYKSKLTARLSDQPGNNNKLTTVSSRQSRNSNSSALSLEPLNLRGNFFSRDDDHSRETPEEGHEVGRAGYFGAAKRGYGAPQEQSRVEQSTEPWPNPGPSRTVSTRYSKTTDNTLRPTSSIYPSSETTRRSSITSMTSNIDPLATAPLFSGANHASPPVPAHRSPPTKYRFFEGGQEYDISDMSGVKGIPGTTPLASPTPDDHMMASSQDPFHGYEMSSTYPGNFIPSPPMGSSENRWSRTEKYDGAAWEASSEFDTLHPKTGSGSTNPGYRHSILKEHLAEMTYAHEKGAASLKSGKGSQRQPFIWIDTDMPDALPKHKKVLRQAQHWYGSFSTRNLILIIVGIVSLIGLILGLSLGLYFNRRGPGKVGLTPTWRPAQGTTWNIQLSKPITETPNSMAYVFDIDLFDNNATTIAMLHKMGRHVICYFSAGTYENWRADAKQFPNSTLGTSLQGWEGERWLDIRDSKVRDIMKARIDLAASKGCDGVDPDNVDGYSTDTSFPFTATDSGEYLNFLAQYAHQSDLAIGLKNAPELINATIDNIDWQINESCMLYKECHLSQPLIQAGKPVLHIEYSAQANATLLQQSCAAPGTKGFSTLVKRQNLDAWSMRCPIGIVNNQWGFDSAV